MVQVRAGRHCARMSPDPTLRTSNLIGILSLCAGVMVFSLQDAILKGLSGSHAVTLAIVLRSVVGLPILLVMVHYESGLKSLRSSNWWALVARGLIEESFTDAETGAINYVTSDLLLQQLGINSLDELPLISPLLDDGADGFEQNEGIPDGRV